ncbi:MAG: DNRLRE domain-containing protein, partial [Actinomycetota bacterium]
MRATAASSRRASTPPGSGTPRLYPVTIDPSIGPREPVLDTFVQSNIQTTPQDRETFLKSGYYSGSEGTFTARSLLRFDLSDVPQGSDISDAELRLFNNHSYSCQHRAVEVRRVTEWWGENVTWSNRPGFAPKVADSINNSLGYNSNCAAGRLNFKVTSLVNYWKNSDAPNRGFGIRAANESDVYGWKRFSSDQGGHPPKLVVTFNNPPQMPNDLEPANNTVDPDPKPTLRARYRDDGAGQVEFRVFNPDGSRRYKKTLAATDGELKSYTVGNPDDDGNSGQLVEGQTYTWDARNVDNHNKASDWTNARSYTVRDQGPTITGITSPTHPAAASWYNRTTAELNWEASDDASPIAGYSIELNAQADFDPPTSVNHMTTSKSYDPIDEGVRYFHVRAVDARGNWGATLSRPLRTDRTDPVIEWVKWWDHPEEQWHQSNDPLVQWLANDGPSGVEGHSYALDSEPDNTFDPVVQPDPGVGVQLTDVADGEHSFKVKSRDFAGNWSPVASYSLKIDASPPSTPTVTSSTHPNEGTYYPADDVALDWSSTDPHSGVVGYSYVLDQNATTTPDDTLENGPTDGPPRTFTDLEPGTHYFHVKAVNAAGGFSAVRHFQIRIEGAPPAPVISSSTHPDPESWYSARDIEFDWTEPDAPSGIAGYSFELDGDSATTPDETVDPTDGARRKLYSGVPEGESYFHVRARTNAGSWGEPGHFRVRIDSSGPSAPPLVLSTSHPPGIGMRDNTVDLTWAPASDSLSGVAGYEYTFAVEGEAPDWTACPDCTTGPAELGVDDHQIDNDGRYTFYVRAVDHAGNKGAPADYGPIVIDQNGSIVPLNPSLDDELVAQSDTNGMEQFYPYSNSPLGSASAFTNLYSGNLVVRQPLATVPGKGLNTVLNLTYNSQRSDDYHDTGVGRGWSLSVSDLDAGLDFAGGFTEIDLAAPVVVGLLDVAGGVAGATGGLLELTDGDGTVHRFVRDGAPGSRWDSPPGVDLKVRENLDPTDPSGLTVASYDLIRPDGVVYTATRNDLLAGGGLTDSWHIRSITDRNSNQLVFGYQQLDPENLRTLTNVRVETISHKTSQDAERVVARLDYDYELDPSGNPLGSGNLESITTLPNGDQREHQIVIDADDELTSVTRNSHVTGAAQGRQTTNYAYDIYTVEHPLLPAETRLLTSVTDARGHASSFDYDSATGSWRHTELLDREGARWRTSYEQADPNTGDRTTSVTPPAAQGEPDATTSHELSGRRPISEDDERIAGGNVEKIADAGNNAGPVVLFYRWQENRLVEKRNALGDTTLMTYNDLGLVTEIDSSAPSVGGGHTERVTTTFDYSAVADYDLASCSSPPPDEPDDRVTSEHHCATVAELDRSVAAAGTTAARATDFAYDDAGDPTAVIARQDAATEHDAPRHPGDRMTTMTYHDFGGLATVDGPRYEGPNATTDDVTTFPLAGYHSSGQPGKIVDARGERVAIAYDPYGLPTSVTDRGGRVTNTTYDELDRPIETRSPDLDVTKFVYDPNGNLTETEASKGVASAAAGDFTTTTTYDRNDRPVQVSSPGTTSDAADLIRSETHYHPDGTIAREVNPVGGETRFSYYANRQLTSQSVPVDGALRGVTDYAYDLAGREVRVTAPEVNEAGQRPVSQTSYTPAGTVAQVSETFEQDDERVTSYAYNAHSEPIEVTGPRANERQTQEFDSFGAVTELKRAVTASKLLTYATGYDAAGNKTAYTQPHGDGLSMTTRFDYDELNRLEQQSDPQNPGHFTTYAYLPEGQQTFRRDWHCPGGEDPCPESTTPTLERKVETSYNHDYTLHSVTSTDSASSGNPTLALNYFEQGQPEGSGYDAHDNLRHSHTVCSGPAEGSGDDCPGAGIVLRTEAMTYDHADRTEELTQSVQIPDAGGPVSRTQQLTYRKDSTLQSSTWDGRTTTYDHTEAGALESMTDWRAAAEASTMDYLPSGAVKVASLGGGVATQSLGYHRDGSVKSLAWEAQGITGPVREHTDITYNASGLRTSEQVAIEPVDSGGDTGGRASFDYDLAGRLSSWTSPFRLEFGDIEGPDSPTTSYELDDGGNITRETLSGGGETYRTTTASFTRARLDDRTVVAETPVEVLGTEQTLTSTTTQAFSYSKLGEEELRESDTSFEVTLGLPP